MSARRYMPRLPRVAGREKMWAVLTGTPMQGAATVMALWGFAAATEVFAPPPPEMIAGAIVAFIAGVFTAAQVYNTGNTPPEAQPPLQLPRPPEYLILPQEARVEPEVEKPATVLRPPGAPMPRPDDLEAPRLAK